MGVERRAGLGLRSGSQLLAAVAGGVVLALFPAVPTPESLAWVWMLGFVAVGVVVRTWWWVPLAKAAMAASGQVDVRVNTAVTVPAEQIAVVLAVPTALLAAPGTVAGKLLFDRRPAEPPGDRRGGGDVAER